MQFKLLLSNTYEQAFLQVLNKLKCQYKLGGKHFVVVPDRTTLNVEKRIFESLNLDSTFDIEVITLSKLASRVLGLMPQKLLSKQSGLLFTTKIILNNKHKLKAFTRASEFLGFSENIFETIMQLKSSNISPNEFKNSKVDNASLKLKIEDIAMLYEAYENELKNEYIDANTKLSVLINEIPKSEFIKNAHFYFALFDSYTMKQYSVIEALMLNANSVTVGAVSNTLQKNANIYLTEQYDFLSNLAKKYYKNIKEIIENENANLKEEWNHILNEYGAYSKSSIYLKNNSIQLFEAKTVKEEVEFLTSNIIKLTQTKNIRYKDINVAVSNMKTYAPVIKEIFNEYNIPFYLDDSKSLYEHHFANYLLQALKTVKNNFSNGDILSLSKNYFTNLSNDEKNLFEDVVLQYGINYRQFLKPFNLPIKNLELLENIRKKIINSLQPFISIKEAVTIKEYVEQIKIFFKSQKVEEKLNLLINNYKKTYNQIEEKRTLQVLDKIETILNDLELLLDKEVMPFSHFYELLLTLIRTTTLSTIPVSVDCVFVGDANNNNFIKNSVLFILGANAENLPSQKSDTGILLDDELGKINTNIKLEPSIYALNKKARFNLFQLLLTASDNLFISYSRALESGKEQKKSEVFSELSQLFHIVVNNKIVELPVYMLNDYLENTFNEKQHAFLPYYFANETVAKQKWIQNYKSVWQEGGIIEEHMNSIYSLLQKKFGKKELEHYISLFSTTNEFPTLSNASKLFFKNDSTKVSQLESYFMNPFNHYLQYGLRLKEKERAGVQPVDIGIILHAVAEKFGQKLKTAKAEIKNIKQTANDIIKEVLDTQDYAYLKNHNEYKNILLGLEKEAVRLIGAIYKEQQNSSFKLKEIEYNFNLKNENVPLTLRGIVDRIDEYENYFRIIDYKTGKSEFSFKELYYGKKIQLFLYALVIEKLIGKKVAGVFYFPVKNEFLEENKNDTLYKMQGSFLQDNVVVKALDNTLSPDNLKSNFVNLKLKKESSENDYVLDEKSLNRSFNFNEWEKIGEYVFSLVNKAVKEILEGNITPSSLTEQKGYSSQLFSGISLIPPNIEIMERTLKSVSKKEITEAE